MISSMITLENPGFQRKLCGWNKNFQAVLQAMAAIGSRTLRGSKE
jgi:hypothetical protein